MAIETRSPGSPRPNGAGGRPAAPGRPAPAPTPPVTSAVAPSASRWTNRRSFLLGLGLAGISIPVASRLRSGGGVERGVTQDLTGLSPAEALGLLHDGNERFVALRDADPNLSTERRVAVSAGQHPFAAVIGCVDSRVPPELVFDRGLGDLFVGRVAGNIADDSIVGSIEFGVEEFDIPLVLVLGHTKCGAVTATVEALEAGATSAPGQIGAVVSALVPAAEEAGGDVSRAIALNVKSAVRALQQSPVLEERISSGALRVTGGVYDLETGVVDFSV